MHLRHKTPALGASESQYHFYPHSFFICKVPILGHGLYHPPRAGYLRGVRRPPPAETSSGIATRNALSAARVHLLLLYCAVIHDITLSPKGLPLIGNILDMPSEKEWLIFSQWADTWGNGLTSRLWVEILMQSTRRHMQRDCAQPTIDYYRLCKRRHRSSGQAQRDLLRQTSLHYG
jgi:hypothetical protein